MGTLVLSNQETQNRPLKTYQTGLRNNDVKEYLPIIIILIILIILLLLLIIIIINSIRINVVMIVMDIVYVVNSIVKKYKKIYNNK